MYITRQPQRGRDRVGKNVTMEEYNFERARCLKYLGAIITDDNKIQGKIRKNSQPQQMYICTE